MISFCSERTGEALARTQVQFSDRCRLMWNEGIQATTGAWWVELGPCHPLRQLEWYHAGWKFSMLKNSILCIIFSTCCKMQKFCGLLHTTLNSHMDSAKSVEDTDRDGQGQVAPPTWPYLEMFVLFPKSPWVRGSRQGRWHVVTLHHCRNLGMRQRKYVIWRISPDTQRSKWTVTAIGLHKWASSLGESLYLALRRFWTFGHRNIFKIHVYSGMAAPTSNARIKYS